MPRTRNAWPTECCRSCPGSAARQPTNCGCSLIFDFRSERRGGVALVGLAVGDCRGEPGPGAFEPLLADRGEPLAAFPEVERLLQGQPACLKPLDHVGELVTGLLVRKPVGLVAARPVWPGCVPRPVGPGRCTVLSGHGLNLAGQPYRAALMGCGAGGGRGVTAGFGSRVAWTADATVPA